MLWNGPVWLCGHCEYLNAVIRKRCRNCGRPKESWLEDVIATAKSDIQAQMQWEDDGGAIASLEVPRDYFTFHGPVTGRISSGRPNIAVR
jgi:hypothetical protein